MKRTYNFFQAENRILAEQSKELEAKKFFVVSKTHREMTGFYETPEEISAKLFKLTNHSGVNERALRVFFRNRNKAAGKIDYTALYLYCLGNIEMSIYQAKD